MRFTKRQAQDGREKGQAVRQAKSAHRLQHLIELSAKGMPKAEAALHVGLTLSGVNGLLFKRLGTKRWPVDQNPTPERGA